MEPHVEKVLADGQLHTVEQLYQAVERSGVLGPEDLMRVPTGPSFVKLRKLGFQTETMSDVQKDALVGEHGLPFELHYKNAVRYALRHLKARGEVENPSHGQYRIVEPGPASFSKADCELFVRYAARGSFGPVPPADKERFRDLRVRLGNVAKWVAQRLDATVPLESMVSVLSPNGNIPADMWCCVYPTVAGNKSYGLQVAMIVGAKGAEFCFCLGAGETQERDEKIVHDGQARFREMQATLGSLPRDLVEGVAGELDADVLRFRRKWRLPAGSSDFNNLAEWLAYASSANGAGASVSMYLTPDELEAAGSRAANKMLSILEVFQDVLAAVYNPASIELLSPGDLCEEFSAAVAASGLRFGSAHDHIVRGFLASVLAKPFIVLTGLSGSGKTQLAVKLGEWLGTDRYQLIPVRPDWTGPESLLGYEDALLPVEDGRRAWHVPQALELMLRAAREPEKPHLLILDEMNLAHVERYFADVLSGFESRQPVLPNLRRDGLGYWRVQKSSEARIPMPRNLVIVGTVNVDETTYMFSPKVLDRANTIEFRVATDALESEIELLVRPVSCKPAADSAHRSVFHVMTSDSWHISKTSDTLRAFGDAVRQIHAELSEHGLEFGHRTYYEALRLAAILEASGVATVSELVDTFLLQKILPRLHGARRKVEPVLRLLGARAVGDPTLTSDFDVLAIAPGTSVAMPRSFSKIKRMVQAMRANQFASFAD